MADLRARSFSLLLERQSLRARLLWTFALVMALGLVPTVLIEEGEEEALAALDRVVQKDLRVSDLALRSIAAFLNARRHEKDFLLYYREFGFREARARYVTQAQTSIAALHQQLRELREVASDRDTHDQTGQIERAASEYLAEFLATVDLYESLAVPNRGLLARFRGTLEELSPARYARSEPRLAAGYVDLYAAGYKVLDDAGTAEYERAIEALDAFARIASASLPANVKAALEARITSYRDTATAIHDATTRIAEHKSAYLKAAQRAEPLLETLHLARVKGAQEALDELHASAQVRDRIILISGALALLSALALAVVIATRVARDVDSLVAYTGQITDGSLDVRAPAVGGKELGQLAHALDTMALRLHESRDALQLRNKELAARNSEISALGDMTNALQACLSVDEAADVIKRFCVREFPADGGAIYVYQSSRNYLDAIATWGERQPLQNFTPNDCWALRRGQTHRVTDARTDPRCAHAGSDADGPASYCCVPMTAQGNILGLVHLAFGADRAPDQENRVRFATVLTDRLALALANLKLRESLRDQSIRDPLTGLYNRRFLEESLERELARARRARHSLAVFMLDADHFKRFNDQFGHEGGDTVLRALGKTIKEACRRNDLPCRLGGEEFTAVLSEIGKEEAVQWGERLLGRVRQLDVESAGGSVGRITISAGMALYPEHGEDIETLLQAADLALYEAKRSGRDRLVVYQGTAAGAKAENASAGARDLTPEA